MSTIKQCHRTETLQYRGIEIQLISLVTFEHANKIAYKIRLLSNLKEHPFGIES